MNVRSIIAPFVAGIILTGCSTKSVVPNFGAGTSANALQLNASHQSTNASLGVLRGSGSTAPTLYILNGYANKTHGWVGAYSDAGATFLRNFGTIEGNGPETTSMAADNGGHLYLYSGAKPGQLLAYENYGASILQTLQFHKGVFSSTTLDHSGNLFAMVTAAKQFAGPLDEFVSTGDGSLKETPFIRRDAVPYYIATDSLGDVASAGGINGLKVYKKKSKNPFWTLNASSTLYTGIAFDPSNNLYVAQEVENSAAASVYVYARGASAPTYTISNGVYAPVNLAVDGSGDLYVLDYCTSSCGSNPSTVIAIYPPGATSPSRTFQPPPGSNFGSFAVSSGGYVAAIEYQSGHYNGPVVVYAPGNTVPSVTISSGLQDPIQVAFGN